MSESTEPMDGVELRAWLSRQVTNQRSGPRTIADVAKSVGISPSGLRAWLHMGTIPAAPAAQLRALMDALG